MRHDDLNCWLALTGLAGSGMTKIRSELATRRLIHAE